MPPRVLRLKSPRGPDGPPIYKALSLAGDRFVAYVHGKDLLVRDLSLGDDAPPILFVEDGENHALVSNTLVTYDVRRGFRRFAREGDRFVESLRFSLPEEPDAWPTFLSLSSSGRFLCFQLPPAAGGDHCRVLLLDATTGQTVAVHPRHLSARASFSQLDGAEILFLSAPSYMGVLMIDCESGRTLQSFEPTESWDFCHTDYELSTDGERLLAFGCIWAAPYEVRLYDARPWTRGAAPAKAGFPLPILYRQNEDLEYETVLPSHFQPNQDGSLDVLSLVSLHELHRLDAEQKRELEEGLVGMNLEILERAWTMEGEAALLQRRVDPLTSNVLSFRLVPIRPVGETHVHALSEHRVMLVGETIQWFDGEAIHDVATLEKPSGWYETAVTQNGDTLVLRELAER